MANSTRCEVTSIIATVICAACILLAALIGLFADSYPCSNCDNTVCDVLVTESPLSASSGKCSAHYSVFSKDVLYTIDYLVDCDEHTLNETYQDKCFVKFNKRDVTIYPGQTESTLLERDPILFWTFVVLGSAGVLSLLSAVLSFLTSAGVFHAILGFLTWPCRRLSRSAEPSVPAPQTREVDLECV